MVFLFNQENQRLARANMEESMQKLVEEKAQVISLKLSRVEDESAVISLWLYQALTKESPAQLKENYKRDENNVLFRALTKTEAKTVNPTQISSAYLPEDLPLSSQIIHEINSTEELDIVFKDVMDRNELVEWIYVITNSGFLRVFPYLNNNVLMPDQEMRNEAFYIDAASRSNPKSKVVWTKPYVDYAGKGWIITCSRPLYIDGQLRAVICMDVSLKSIEKAMEDFRLSKSGFAFLIDGEGNIIYHPDFLPTETKQGDRIQGNLTKGSPEEYKQIIQAMRAGSHGIGEYKKDGKETRTVAYTAIEDLNWSIGMEVNPDDYLLGTKKVTENIIILGIILTMMLAVFGIFLFTILSKPLVQLTKNAKRISEGEFGKTVEIKSVDEIGVLSTAFNTMSMKILSDMKDISHNKEQLELIVNSIGNLLMVLDRDYRILMMNNYGTRQFQSCANACVGSACYLLSGMKQPCLGCPVPNALLNNRETFGEVIRDNEIFQVWAYPSNLVNGIIEEIVVFSKNVTEEIVIQHDLAQAKKLAGIGQLAAGVTHELKNPIGVIKGTVHLLRSRPLEPEDMELVYEIEENLNRAEKIISNLLDFSRASNTVKYLVNLKELIEQVLLLEKASLIKHHIGVVIKIEDNLSAYGYIDSFKHIFLNIINNAIVSMPSGGILEIMGTKKGNYAEISFVDNGCGISEEIREKIFLPFFSTRRTENGTGLGLWIVQRELNKNNGTISVNSLPGQGTSFTITLPLNEIN